MAHFAEKILFFTAFVAFFLSDFAPFYHINTYGGRFSSNYRFPTLESRAIVTYRPTDTTSTLWYFSVNYQTHEAAVLGGCGDQSVEQSCSPGASTGRAIDSTNRESIVNLQIPETLLPTLQPYIFKVTEIQPNAFYGYKCLSSISIPPSVTSIGKEAFAYCVLESMSIPTIITELPEGLFKGNVKLSNLNFGAKILKIGNNTFSGCISLTNIIYCSSYSNISFNEEDIKYIWYNTPNLNVVSVLSDYSSNSWCGKDVVKTANVYTTENTSILYTFHNDDLNISGNGPITVSDISKATNIDKCITCDNITKITSLIIGEGITSIEDGAFANCSRLSGVLKFPSSLTLIGDSAFESCSALSNELIFPENCVYIGAKAFYNCHSFKGKVEFQSIEPVTISENSFRFCQQIQRLIIRCCDTIGDFAFSNCNLLIHLDMTSVKEIGQNAFELNTILNSVTIPKDCVKIGNLAFRSCQSMTSITFCGRIDPGQGTAGNQFDGIADRYTLSVSKYYPLETFCGITIQEANKVAVCIGEETPSPSAYVPTKSINPYTPTNEEPDVPVQLSEFQVNRAPITSKVTSVQTAGIVLATFVLVIIVVGTMMICVGKRKEFPESDEGIIIPEVGIPQSNIISTLTTENVTWLNIDD